MLTFASFSDAHETNTGQAIGSIEKPPIPALQIIERALREEASGISVEALDGK
jgi:hypothetical protein